MAKTYQSEALEAAHETATGLHRLDRIHTMRLEELREEIKKGIESGEPMHLDIGAIKARGRKRLAAEQKGITSWCRRFLSVPKRKPILMKSGGTELRTTRTRPTASLIRSRNDRKHGLF